MCVMIEEMPRLKVTMTGRNFILSAKKFSGYMHKTLLKIPFHYQKIVKENVSLSYDQ